MQFLCSTYDGSPKEWVLNETKEYATGIGAEAALHMLCRYNDAPSIPFAPDRFFGDTNIFCLVCRWSMSGRSWPFIIVLHDKPMSQEQLDRFLATIGVHIPTTIGV